MGVNHLYVEKGFDDISVFNWNIKWNIWKKQLKQVSINICSIDIVTENLAWATRGLEIQRLWGVNQNTNEEQGDNG